MLRIPRAEEIKKSWQLAVVSWQHWKKQKVESRKQKSEAGTLTAKYAKYAKVKRF